VSEAENFPFVVKMSSNEKKMKKQHEVFSVDEKMQILPEVAAYVGGSSGSAWFVGINFKHNSE
jgi:hypothetical protein